MTERTIITLGTASPEIFLEFLLLILYLLSLHSSLFRPPRLFTPVGYLPHSHTLLVPKWFNYRSWFSSAKHLPGMNIEIAILSGPLHQIFGWGPIGFLGWGPMASLCNTRFIWAYQYSLTVYSPNYHKRAFHRKIHSSEVYLMSHTKPGIADTLDGGRRRSR